MRARREQRHPIDVVALSEIKSLGNDPDGIVRKFDADGMKLLYKHRNAAPRNGGGVAVAYAVDRFASMEEVRLIDPQNGADLDCGKNEIIAIRLKPLDDIAKPFVIMSVYLPPPVQGVAANEEDAEKLAAVAQAISADIVIGDLNGRHPEWDTALEADILLDPGLANQTNVRRGDFLHENLVDNLGMRVSAPNEPTHVPRYENHRPSTIDVAFVGGAVAQALGVDAEPVGTSDHRIVVHALRIGHELPATVPVRRWRKPRAARIAWTKVTQWQIVQFQRQLVDELDRVRDFDRLTPSEMEKRIRNAITRAMGRFPRVSKSTKQRALRLPRDIAAARDECKQAWALWFSRRQEEDADELRAAASEAHHRLVELCEQFAERLFAEEDKLDIKDTMAWRAFQESVNPRDIAECAIRFTDSAGVEHVWDTHQKKADGFAASFAERAHPNFPADPDFAAAVPAADRVPVFTAAEVAAALDAHGCRVPDLYGMDRLLMRHLPRSGGNRRLGVLWYLSRLFYKTVVSGRMPAAWLYSEITCLPKTGKDHSVPKGYRALAASTPLLGRTFERCLNRRLQQLFDQSEEQAGFRQGRGVLQPLLDTVLTQLDAAATVDRDVRGNNNNNNRTHTVTWRSIFIQVDGESAYDSVDSETVVKSFRSIWRDENEARHYEAVLAAYLRGRSIRVVYKDAISERQQMHGGCPQGSCLSPTIFLIVAEDIIRRVKAALPDLTTATAGDPNSRCLVGHQRHPNLLTQRHLEEQRGHELSPTALWLYADDKGMLVSGCRPIDLLEFTKRACNLYVSELNRKKINASAKSTITYNKFRGGAGAGADHDLNLAQTPAVAVPGTPGIKIDAAPHRTLGVVLGSAPAELADHHTAIILAAKWRIGQLGRIAAPMRPKQALAIYMGGILGQMLHACEVWWPLLSNTQRARLESVHARGIKVALGLIRTAPNADVLMEAGTPPLYVIVSDRIEREAEKMRLLPDENPARQRMMHESPRATTVADQGGGARARANKLRAAMCDPMPDVPRLPRCFNSEKPLFPCYETWQAGNVSFITPDPDTPKKDAMPPEQQLCLNKLWLEEALNNLGLPAQYLRMTTDGSFTPEQYDPETNDKEPAKAGYAAITEIAHLDDACPPTIINDLTRRGVVRDGVACSYSAEQNALYLGVRTFWEQWHTGENHHPVDMPVPYEPGVSPAPRPLLIVSDSLSSIMAIKKGPLALGDLFEHRVWDLLLKIAVHRRICLCFVYSHCGLDFHDRVDTEATAAAEAPDDAHEVSDVWFKDAIRPARTARRREWIADYKSGRERRLALRDDDNDDDDDDDDGNEQDLEPWRLKARDPIDGLPLGPSPRLLDLPRRRAATVYGMRVGCCPALGGAYYESAPETCPVCNDATISRARRGQEQGGVEHFLCCDAQAARAARHAVFGNDGAAIPQDVLYVNDRAEQLLQYFDAFVALRQPQQPQQQAEE